jgi:CDP-diacylglycerol--glycerol-3-phosphate 3-phosphatidyltransferase
LAGIVIIIIWISDLLDGYLARQRNEISELGKIIDPVADKTAIISISIVMILKGLIPVWFFIIVVLRDVLILSGGLYLKASKNIVLQSNWIGKVTVFMIGFTILIYLFSNINIFLSYHNEFTELLLFILLLLSLVMIVFSIISYLKRFFQAFNRRV